MTSSKLFINLLNEWLNGRHYGIGDVPPPAYAPVSSQLRDSEAFRNIAVLSFPIVASL